MIAGLGSLSAHRSRAHVRRLARVVALVVVIVPSSLRRRGRSRLRTGCAPRWLARPWGTFQLRGAAGRQRSLLGRGRQRSARLRQYEQRRRSRHTGAGRSGESWRGETAAAITAGGRNLRHPRRREHGVLGLWRRRLSERARWPRLRQSVQRRRRRTRPRDPAVCRRGAPWTGRTAVAITAGEAHTSLPGRQCDERIAGHACRWAH